MQYTEIQWRKGQPYSERFDDIYYSDGPDVAETGEGEFRHVFLAGNRLPQRWSQGGDFVIAELGFGSGLNCMLTIREWLQHLESSGEEKTLHYIAIEKYPLSPQAITELLRIPSLQAICRELTDAYPPAVEAAHRRSLFGGRVIMHYRFMDVATALDTEGLNVDSWYLDGFAPGKNPDMWSQALFVKMATNSRDGATCSTYSAAGLVRRNLEAAGFRVSKQPGYGRKREMITAELTERHTPELYYRDRPWYALPVLDKAAGADNRVCILGGGIAGLSAAYALVQRGWQVEIIDRQGALCHETSSNPSVIVYPRLSAGNARDNEFYISAYCHALYELNRLQQGSDERFWLDDGLMHYLDADRAQKIISACDLNSDFISVHQSDEESQAIVEYAGAGVLLPAGLCRSLRVACGDRLTVTRASISHIAYRDGQWWCNDGEQNISRAAVLIVASGGGESELHAPWTFPIERVRGQITVLRENRHSSRVSKTVNRQVHITPAIEGRHYLGASYNRDCNEPGLREEDDRYLLGVIESAFPGCFSEEDIIDGWAGFRHIARDRVPVAGAVHDEDFFRKQYADIRNGNTRKVYPPARHYPGLYVSLAHGSRGFTTAFLSAEILAAMIAGGPLPVSREVMDYLNPSRFLVHQLQRG